MHAANSPELVDYIRLHLAELCRLAQRRKVQPLAYLIEMAWLEAELVTMANKSNEEVG